jgi:hypothetical protein
MARDESYFTHLFRMLGEVFRCTDTVVAMLHNRREIISLAKLAKAVQVKNRSIGWCHFVEKKLDTGRRDQGG